MKTIQALAERVRRPVRVLQFGEGNFLRAFSDCMIDIANEKGIFDGSIAVVKPKPTGSLERFRRQDCMYTVVFRGRRNGETVDSALTEMIHVIGENMKVLRFQRVTVENGAMTGYIHLGGKLADIVVCEFSKPETGATDEFKAFAHDVAMHIAATAPVATTREDVPAATVEHEMSIYKAQAAESGKPEAIQERMAQGRLEKYFKEFVLCEQEFVKDSSVTIDGLAKKVSKSLGDDIKVKTFVLYRFGEEA